MARKDLVSRVYGLVGRSVDEGILEKPACYEIK